MHDRASFDGVLDAAQKIAEERFLPHAAQLDANEPQFENGRVRLIPEVKKALAALIDGGFLAASFPESEGGLQLPYTLTSAAMRSEEHTSELQSLMRISYAVFCLKKKKT